MYYQTLSNALWLIQNQSNFLTYTYLPGSERLSLNCRQFLLTEKIAIPKRFRSTIFGSGEIKVDQRYDLFTSIPDGY